MASVLEKKHHQNPDKYILYKSYLVLYAHRRLTQKKLGRTIKIRKTSGTIFSNNKITIDTVQKKLLGYQKYFSKNAGKYAKKLVSNLPQVSALPIVPTLPALVSATQSKKLSKFHVMNMKMASHHALELKKDLKTIAKEGSDFKKYFIQGSKKVSVQTQQDASELSKTALLVGSSVRDGVTAGATATAKTTSNQAKSFLKTSKKAVISLKKISVGFAALIIALLIACKNALVTFKNSLVSFKNSCVSFKNSITRPIFKKITKIGRSIRLLRRYNRKKRFEFVKELKSQSSAFHQHWLIRGILAPIRPFYYSLRYFPLHSFFAIVLSAIIFGSTYTLHEMIFKDLPSVMELTTSQPIVSSKILDRNGQVLYSVYKDENRTLVPLSFISDDLISATIAIEDKDFYTHHGFSTRGIIRAAISNSQTGASQGGSTITQQLVKNRLLSPERTFTRKIKELILSVLVEGAYEKDEILSMYLNQVAYGGSTYGIEAASQRYFGKHASQLDLAEAALLAGLPQAPSVYSPYGANPDLAKQRQQEVLRRMVEDQYISQTEADEATQETLSFQKDQIEIQAPHFVMYVRQLLAEQYGEDRVTSEGLEIRTSLDLGLQNKAQEIVTKEVDQLKRLRISNGAALITNPKTGEILAMVGSTDYFDFAHDGQVNVTLRERQPGSSIKPLTYAIAIERGSTVNSIIQDEPVTYISPGSPPYAPKNYDGKYHGNVTLKESLGSSYNIPAVKTLDSVGINTMISKAEEMGITTWKNRKRYGLSLTLGGGEVKMIDMNSVYSAFANQGIATAANPILEIKNFKGEVLYRNTCALDGKDCSGKKVLDPKTAFLISNILSDNTNRIPAFGPQSELFIPGQEVAVKTGTTNSLRDNWAIGYTSDRLVSVWVGNNDNTPMSYVASGVTGASPIWNKIIRTQLDEKNPHKFAVPPGMVRTASCFKTEQYYVQGTEPRSESCPVIKRAEVKQPEKKPTTDKKPNQNKQTNNKKQPVVATN